MVGPGSAVLEVGGGRPPLCNGGRPAFVTKVHVLGWGGLPSAMEAAPTLRLS